MRKIALFIGAIFLYLFTSQCFAFDWAGLHEKADKIRLGQAESALQNKPDSLEDLYVLGLAYLDKRDGRQAAVVFDKILSLSPDNLPAKWGRAEVLRRSHQYENSEKLLNDVIKADPGFYPAYISLAYIEYIRMNFEKAVSLARSVLQRGRDKVDTSNYVRAMVMVSGAKGTIAYYGGIFSKLFNGAGVFPMLKKAESIQPQSPAVLFGLGSFYLLAPKVAGGNIDKALDYLGRAEKADPLFADIYARLAQAYKLRGDNTKFNEYLERALELDPQSEIALDIKNNLCKFACPGS